jgi:hypothetical protein
VLLNKGVFIHLWTVPDHALVIACFEGAEQVWCGQQSHSVFTFVFPLFRGEGLHLSSGANSVSSLRASVITLVVQEKRQVLV